MSWDPFLSFNEHQCELTELLHANMHIKKSIKTIWVELDNASDSHLHLLVQQQGNLTFSQCITRQRGSRTIYIDRGRQRTDSYSQAFRFRDTIHAASQDQVCSKSKTGWQKLKLMLWSNRTRNKSAASWINFDPLKVPGKKNRLLD